MTGPTYTLISTAARLYVMIAMAGLLIDGLDNIAVSLTNAITDREHDVGKRMRPRTVSRTLILSR